VQDLPLEDLPVLGALEVERTSEGLVLHRLPAWARAQTSDPMLSLVEAMPAGVRVAMSTDATALELDVALKLVQFPDRPPVPAVFDLVVDGEVRDSVSTTIGTTLSLDAKRELVVTHGPPTTVRLDSLPGDRAAHVEVWLPHAATVTILGARVSDGATVSADVPSAPRWIHYGSSISHCLEANSPVQTWPGAVARRAGWDLLDLGLGGQCMVDPFVARIIRDLPAEVISAKIGINVVNGDTFRERTFVPALHGFLDMVRDGHPDTPLLLITPIHCPSAETAPGPTLLQPDGRFDTVPRPEELAVGALSLVRIRKLVTSVVESRTAAGDKNLHLLDGLTLFGADDEKDLYDGLHPNAEGYLRMAERFFAQVCAPGGVFDAFV